MRLNQQPVKTGQHIMRITTHSSPLTTGLVESWEMESLAKMDYTNRKVRREQKQKHGNLFTVMIHRKLLIFLCVCILSYFFINVKQTRKSSVKPPSPPPAVTEEYRRPVTERPLLPSDYSRGSTQRDAHRAIKRRIKPRVSVEKWYFFCNLEHNVEAYCLWNP